MLVVGLMEVWSHFGVGPCYSPVLALILGVGEGGLFTRPCGISIRFEAAVGGWVQHLTSSLFHRPTGEQETGFPGRL